MALDTSEKRQNAAGAGRVFMRTHFPIATPDEQWRIAGGIAYGGNALTPAAAGGELLSIRHIRNFNRELVGGMR